MADTLIADLPSGSGSPSTSVTAAPSAPVGDAVDSIFDNDDIVQLHDRSIGDETDIHDGVMTAPGQAAEETPADAPADAKALGVDRGDGRDALGRWVGRGPDPDPAATAAANEAAKATETAPAKVDPVPFRYRSMGETKGLDGATMDGEGNVTVPKNHLATLREAFNALDVVKTQVSPLLNQYKGDIQRLTNELAHAKSSGTQEQQRAKVLVDQVTNMMKEPDDEKFLDAMLRIRAGWELTLAKTDAEFWKTKAGAPRAGAEKPTPAAPAAPPVAADSLPSKDQAIRTATDYAEQFKIGTEFRDISPASWKQYDEQVSRMPFAFYRPATAEDAKNYGVKVGSVVFDTDQAYAAMEAHAKAVRSQRESETRTRTVAADNARRTQTSVQTPPRVDGERPRGTPGKAPQNKAELNAWLESDDI